MALEVRVGGAGHAEVLSGLEEGGEPSDSGGKDADGPTVTAPRYNFYGLPVIWTQCEGRGGLVREGQWKDWSVDRLGACTEAGNRQEKGVAAR